jgi:hypothetical protein
VLQECPARCAMLNQHHVAADAYSTMQGMQRGVYCNPPCTSDLRLGSWVAEVLPPCAHRASWLRMGGYAWWCTAALCQSTMSRCILYLHIEHVLAAKKPQFRHMAELCLPIRQPMPEKLGKCTLRACA